MAEKTNPWEMPQQLPLMGLGGIPQDYSNLIPDFSIKGADVKVPVAPPSRPNDKTINESMQAGANRKAEQSNYFPNQLKKSAQSINPLAAAFMGILKSIPNAMAMAKYRGDAIAPLAGLASGFGAATEMEEAQKAQQTVRQAIPGIAEAYPELADMDINTFIKVAGPLSSLSKSKVPMADVATQKMLMEYGGLTEEEAKATPQKSAQFLIGEKGKGERFATGEANKEARLRLKAQLTESFNLDPETSPRTMTDDEGRAYLWTGKNWRLISQRMDKANAGALSDVVSAISGLGNIDTFYDKIDNTMFPQLSQVAGKSGAIGGATAFIFPDVAQARAATTTLFTFAKGGKALTETEMKMIDNLFTNLPYKSQQREDAKANVKNYLINQIRATMAGNLTGSARQEVEDMLEKAVGGKQAPKQAPQSKQEDVVELF